MMSQYRIVLEKGKKVYVRSVFVCVLYENKIAI